MGLFGHDDEDKQQQPADQNGQENPDAGQVPTDAGVNGGGADDLQGAAPTAQPPVDEGTGEVPGAEVGGSEVPTEGTGTEEEGGEEDQTPPPAA